MAPDFRLTPEIKKRCAELGVITANLKGQNGFAAVNGPTMRGGQIIHSQNHFRMRWGVLRWTFYSFPNANLVVPDESRDFPFVPLSPNQCFIAHHPAAADTKIDEGSLNERAKQEAKKYYFKCSL